MTPELQATIDDAYRVFGAYTIGPRLVVCHCPCCMTDRTEHELVSTPLRQIPSPLLAEYTNSAHVWDDEQVAREMRYFLPRYFELIAANDPPDYLGLDICLRRLEYAHWREKWPAAEAAVIDRFFDDLLVASLPRLDVVKRPAGWRLTFDIADVLTLAIRAGGDVARVLAAWDAAADPPAVIHMAAARRAVIRQTDRTYLYSAFLEDHAEAADQVGAFLIRPEVDARIEAALSAVTDEGLAEVLMEGVGRGLG